MRCEVEERMMKDGIKFFWKGKLFQITKTVVMFSVICEFLANAVSMYMHKKMF